jgi:phosphoglycerate dehydrogenase-like enzyme
VFDRPLGDEAAVAEVLRPFQVIVAMRERTPFPASLLARLPALRLLVTTGMRNLAIDVAAARRQGVVLAGTEMLGHAAFEHAWALIMAVTKQIVREDRAMHAGRWQVGVGIGLKGRTLGVLGLGRLGSQIARIGLAFGMEVIAWSEHLSAERAAECGARRVDKDELFATADVLTIHLVLSERTRGLVGARELALMKRSAYLINTSRGPIVDEAALIEALRTQAGQRGPQRPHRLRRPGDVSAGLRSGGRGHPSLAGRHADPRAERVASGQALRLTSPAALSALACSFAGARKCSSRKRASHRSVASA